MKRKEENIFQKYLRVHRLIVISQITGNVKEKQKKGKLSLNITIKKITF